MDTNDAAGGCYEVARSSTGRAIHIICRDEAFYRDVPPAILKLGPWFGLGRGNVSHLKPHYRLLLADQGFALVYQPIGVFRAEAQ